MQLKDESIRLAETARKHELEQAREIEKAHKDLQQTHEHLKTTQAQLIQSEKMASLGHLTAGIAHEIKNPLNFVNNFAQLNRDLVSELKDKVKVDEEIDELLTDLKSNSRQIAKHGDRADQVVKNMMQLASNSEGNRYMVDVNALVIEYVKLAYGSFQSRQTDVEVKINKNLSDNTGSLKIAPQDIGRVLQNILVNSFEAVQEKKRSTMSAYEPEVEVSTFRANGHVNILITDNGSGIPSGVQDRIFEPFFTTKPTGSGTGLGLSISYDIVTQGHGGHLSVESVEGEKTSFTIILPGQDA